MRALGKLLLGWATGGWSWFLEAIPIFLEHWREITIGVLAAAIFGLWQYHTISKNFNAKRHDKQVQRLELEIAEGIRKSEGCEASLTISKSNQSELELRLAEQNSRIAQMAAEVAERKRLEAEALARAAATGNEARRLSREIRRVVSAAEGCEMKAEAAASALEAVAAGDSSR